MFPEKIVCLSGESADICNRLGAADRVAAVSVFAPRSMRAGRTVAEVFSTLKTADLLAMEPDLVRSADSGASGPKGAERNQEK